MSEDDGLSRASTGEDVANCRSGAWELVEFDSRGELAREEAGEIVIGRGFELDRMAGEATGDDDDRSSEGIVGTCSWKTLVCGDNTSPIIVVIPAISTVVNFQRKILSISCYRLDTRLQVENLKCSRKCDLPFG